MTNQLDNETSAKNFKKIKDTFAKMHSKPFGKVVIDDRQKLMSIFRECFRDSDLPGKVKEKILSIVRQSDGSLEKIGANLAAYLNILEKRYNPSDTKAEKIKLIKLLGIKTSGTFVKTDEDNKVFEDEFKKIAANKDKLIEFAQILCAEANIVDIARVEALSNYKSQLTLFRNQHMKKAVPEKAQEAEIIQNKFMDFINSDEVVNTKSLQTLIGLVQKKVNTVKSQAPYASELEIAFTKHLSGFYLEGLELFDITKPSPEKPGMQK